ncbi:uncharacterized protein LOC109605874 [Aethina tumida]|uniref:uncharacterized protein LOC109605874 n=1 Tax=Aethina tumida TaxID=116153 RepID=UPI00096B47CE|nr:uncharacterized protein LOC109605874 [Aethina tumida]
MSNLFRYVPNILPTVQKLSSRFAPTANNFHSLTQDSNAVTKPGGLFSVFTRNIIRVHFPRPSENKRVKRHGYKKRMSTKEGRRVLMNRILKGRFVYSH